MTATNNRGFTLLELAVVLGIIVVITHLAVREAGKWRSSQLHAIADKGLGEIKEAILGSDFERDAEGTRIRTGFLADMGRLPRAETNALGRLTLSELWLCPAAADRFAVRPAVASNLVSTADADDADADVVVPCGWRRPYLRLALGKTRLLDAWGNAYETPDDAQYTARLRTWNQAAITERGTTVCCIRHLGADGVPDDVKAPSTPEEVDTVLNLFDTGGGVTNSSLTVTVNAYDSDGNPASGIFPGTVRVYSPCGGQIAVSKQTLSVSAGTAHATVSGLTPGPRVLRTECNGHKGFPRQLVVQPGANSVADRLKVD